MQSQAWMIIYEKCFRNGGKDYIKIYVYLKQVAENLLNHKDMRSDGFTTYNEFFNAILNETHQTIADVYTLPDACKSEYRYVNDVLTKSLWENWFPSDNVYISAGTGRGKNTFIKMELLKHIGDAKVVIFENRESLMQQQIMDIVSEIDPDALKYQDISEESMVVFGSRKNIMLISYQSAALKCALGDSRFYEFCKGARYLVFDEAHYILDDADFNKRINFFVSAFMLQSTFPNATKIFMSGSMEEFYAFTQTLQPFTSKPNDIYKEKELIDKRGGEASFNLTRAVTRKPNECYALSMPTDYSYIIPYKYRELDDICSQIAQTAIDEKWLIFVKSIEEGFKLQSALQRICGDSVCFLNAKNKKNDENKEIYNQLVNNSKFDCRVLIATTVIYNGVNIKDKDVKHIVVPFTTVSVVKQLIGRKRMEADEKLNVYFPDVTYKEIKKKYQSNIGEYLELMTLRNELPIHSMVQLNDLSYSKPSKYYYLTLQNVNNAAGRFMMLSPMLNLPSIHKLYCDTCFYIFALHRMNPEQEKASDFTSILLAHLGISDKCADVISIITQTLEEKRDSIRQELAEYLEKLIDSPIVVMPDNEDSCNAMLDLKRVINEAHKILHGGKRMDDHWHEADRFFTAKNVTVLLSELALPYSIESAGKKGTITITVTKQE